jgi:alcohol dehydrogenase, propanol-preferring
VAFATAYPMRVAASLDAHGQEGGCDKGGRGAAGEGTARDTRCAGSRAGSRSGDPWLGAACRSCRHCVSGWETLCASQTNSGYSVNGSHAEYAVANSAYVVPVPPAVSSLDAAPLTCAGVRTYKAVNAAGTRPAERMAVFGAGGLADHAPARIVFVF